MDVPLTQITWLLALLILPWTFKFVWAPLVDLLRHRHWGFREWILASQGVMVATLLPLLWLDLRQQFFWTAVALFLHALAAATQDVAIDALCIHSSAPAERAKLNGWMQCGMLSGRALMGGGSLILENYLGYTSVVLVLITLVACSALLVWFARERASREVLAGGGQPMVENLQLRAAATFREVGTALQSRAVWIGLAFAALAPAAFKSLEAVIGPFLIDREYSELEIGQFTATAMIGFMIAGSLLAGYLADRLPGKRMMGWALIFNVACIACLAITDSWMGQQRGPHLLMLLSLVAVSIGVFTVSLYAWLMNLTRAALAATQFTAFMAATNLCEVWSTWTFGRLQLDWGYSQTMLILCGVSLLTGSLLIVELETTQQPSGDQPEGSPPRFD